jgi:hypothetical protein
MTLIGFVKRESRGEDILDSWVGGIKLHPNHTNASFQHPKEREANL